MKVKIRSELFCEDCGDDIHTCCGCCEDFKVNEEIKCLDDGHYHKGCVQKEEKK